MAPALWDEEHVTFTLDAEQRPLRLLCCWFLLFLVLSGDGLVQPALAFR